MKKVTYNAISLSRLDPRTNQRELEIKRLYACKVLQIIIYHMHYSQGNIRKLLCSQRYSRNQFRV